MNELQQRIAQLVDQRSKALHTGDIPNAMATRAALMLAWAELPNHAPTLIGVIHHNGYPYRLQSVRGALCTYVPLDEYNATQKVIAPTDFKTRLLTELHMTNAALYEISELKASGIDPIGEQDETEIA